MLAKMVSLSAQSMERLKEASACPRHRTFSHRTQRCGGCELQKRTKGKTAGGKERNTTPQSVSFTLIASVLCSVSTVSVMESSTLTHASLFLLMCRRSSTRSVFLPCSQHSPLQHRYTHMSSLSSQFRLLSGSVHTPRQIISSPIRSCSTRNRTSYTPFSSAGVITATLNFIRFGFAFSTTLPSSLMRTPAQLTLASKRTSLASVTGRSRCQ